MEIKMFLNRKKVLFIGYEYYNYHERIKETLVQAGADVDYFPVMNYTVFYTLFRNINFKLFLRYNEIYGNNILNKTKTKKYDYIFVIQGFQLPHFFFRELRKNNSNAIFLNYHWDSIRTTEYKNTYLDYLKYFDRVFSFDPKDCEKHADLIYLPLFYLPEYANNSTGYNNVDNLPIDILFIGSINKYRRYEFINRVREFCLEKNFNFYSFLHVNRRLFYKLLLSGKRLKNVNFNSITHGTILSLYKKSKAVIDFPNQIQSGLTMRTFEVLASNKKLITTNKYIKEESFYDPNFIYIISNTGSFEIDYNFINNKVDYNLDMSKYSISNWLYNIFFHEG